MSRFFSSAIAMRPYYRIFRLAVLKFVPANVRGHRNAMGVGAAGAENGNNEGIYASSLLACNGGLCSFVRMRPDFSGFDVC